MDSSLVTNCRIALNGAVQDRYLIGIIFAIGNLSSIRSVHFGEIGEVYPSPIIILLLLIYHTHGS